MDAADEARGRDADEGEALPSTWARRSAGTAGPILTPATLGQAIPTTKPATPMIPTRDHSGVSLPGRGMSTVSGRSDFAIARLRLAQVGGRA